MKGFTAAVVAVFGAVVTAQDLGTLLSSCASDQFQELGLTGVDGDPCKGDAGKSSYYKCSCTTGQDFVIDYLCKNPGSCSPEDIPGLSDTLVSFCKSIGVTVTPPSNPCGVAGGSSSSSGAPASSAPASSAPASSAPTSSAPASSAAASSAVQSSVASSVGVSAASSPSATTPAGTPTTPAGTPAGTPIGTPAVYTGAAAAIKNAAGGVAGVAGLAGLLVL
ncbi:cfem domain containing protein [Diplodia corticola]|uniref:Cfem domain containing protein n=1 Tax=Diplodia corticola TaxID=236234 RepID=A0A1J9S1H2_9PEZI|nr:cfem domain containing protein [Diplodia corticola]OJD33509.1 cfem domain containing protein [Diplodia corticola]